MALSDIPKFQAAVTDDSALQEELKNLVKSMTEGVGMPLNAASNVDWSPLTALASKLGFDFSPEEIKEALFGGGRELSEDELDAAIGAGGLFSMVNFGNFGQKLGIKGIQAGSGDDTIHGIAEKIQGGLGDDTIHGKR